MIWEDLTIRTIEFIPTLYEVMVSGILSTATLLFVVHVMNEMEVGFLNISQTSRFSRIWDIFYSKMIDPTGRFIADLLPKEISDEASYYFGTSITGLIFSMTLFITASVVLLGVALITFFTFGIVPDVSPAIEILAGISILLGWATIGQAEQTSKNFA